MALLAFIERVDTRFMATGCSWRPFFWNTIMFSRLMVALIAVEKRSKWLFDRKRLSGAEFCGHMIEGIFNAAI